jgi:RHS repeat-associated protein
LSPWSEIGELGRIGLVEGRNETRFGEFGGFDAAYLVGKGLIGDGGYWTGLSSGERLWRSCVIEDGGEALDGDIGGFDALKLGGLRVLSGFSGDQLSQLLGLGVCVGVLDQLRQSRPRIVRFGDGRPVVGVGRYDVEFCGEGGESWTIQVLDEHGLVVLEYGFSGDSGSLGWEWEELGCGDGLYDVIGTYARGDVCVTSCYQVELDGSGPGMAMVCWQEADGSRQIIVEYSGDVLGFAGGELLLCSSRTGDVLDSIDLSNPIGRHEFSYPVGHSGGLECVVLSWDQLGNVAECRRGVVSEAGSSFVDDIFNGSDDVVAGMSCELTSPQDGEQILTTVVGVHGSASSDCGESSYTVLLRDSSGRLLSCFGEERSTGWLLTYVQGDLARDEETMSNPFRQMSVDDGLLCELDLSGLSNGLYSLELLVRCACGTSRSNRDLVLSKGRVLGAFEVGERDGIVSIGGLCLELMRHYSSGNPVFGEFGVGWSGGLGRLVGEFSEAREDVVTIEGGICSVRCGGSRDVTLDLPDGRRGVFRFELEGGGMGFSYVGKWVPPAGFSCELHPLVSSELVLLPGLSPYWVSGGVGCPWERFDFPGFVLRMSDGNSYFYEREYLGEVSFLDEGIGVSLLDCYGEMRLTRIEGANGMTWHLSEDGIFGRRRGGEMVAVVRYERDNRGRVVRGELCDGSGTRLEYGYGALGQLVSFRRLSGGVKQVSTRYLYEDSRFPCHLTGIERNGIRVLEVRYDDRGGYCGVSDGTGGEASFKRDAHERYEVVTDAQGIETVRLLDDLGRMTEVISADGSRQACEYDANGFLSRTIDGLGRQNKFTYDCEGRLLRRIDPEGYSINYNYGGDGRSVTMTDEEGRKTKVEYDINGKQQKILLPSGVTLRRELSSTGLPVKLYRGDDDEVLAWLEYNSQGLVSSMTCDGGYRVEYEYGLNGELRQQVQRYFHPVSGEETVVETLVEMDLSGRVVGSSDTTGRWVKFKYDEHGNLCWIQDSSGRDERHLHDCGGRLLETVDVPRGLVWRRVYDAVGRILYSSECGEASLSGDKSPDDISFSGGYVFRYDNLGRMVGKEYVVGSVVRRLHGRDGYVNALLVRGEVAWSSGERYDLGGQVVERKTGRGEVFKYGYDGSGRCTRMENGNGYSCDFSFDGLGNVTSVYECGALVEEREYDSGGRLRRFRRGTDGVVETDYSGTGCLLSEVDGSGRRREYGYDVSGRLVRVEYDEGVVVAQYGIDSLGLTNEYVDGLGRVRRYLRDGFGRLEVEEDSCGGRTRYEYDFRGFGLSSVEYPSGRRKRIIYDIVGNRSCIEYESESGEVERVSYGHDGYGRTSRVSDDSGDWIEYVRDENGRLLVVKSDDGQWVRYGHGRFDDVMWVESPAGLIEYGRDQSGRVASLRSGDVCFDFVRDSRGLVRGIALGDDQCMEASYDACGRMVSLAEAGVWSCEYQLDSSGRYSGVAEQCEGRRVAKTWEYDAFGRMSRYVTKDDRNGETTCSWNYDVCGNLVSEAAQKNGAKEERIYEYDDCDRLVRLKRKNGSGESVTDFQWNADGELLGVVGRGSERTVRTYSWDSRGRLGRVVFEAERIIGEISYEYGLNGLLKKRIARWVENGVEHVESNGFLYDELGCGGLGSLLSQRIERDGVVEELLYLHEGEWLVGCRIGEEVRRFRTNALGNVCAVETGGDWHVVDFDSWGDVLEGDLRLSGGIGYCGEWQDQLAGLVYLRGRFYSPEWRRFISPDRHPGDFRRPETLNKYVYCMNEPMNYRDPTGRYGVHLALARMAMCIPAGIQRLISRFVIALDMASFRPNVKELEDVLLMQLVTLGVESRERTADRASVVVHGVSYHQKGYADSFIRELGKRRPDHDWYEFLWSGFATSDYRMTIPHRGSHEVAMMSLIGVLVELKVKGYSTVNVVAHSWGTVLSKDAMNYCAYDVGCWATMGSPLGMTEPLFPRKSWHNYYSMSDPVVYLSMVLYGLDYTEDVLPLIWQQLWLHQHDVGIFPVLEAHTQYWSNPRVIWMLANQL